MQVAEPLFAARSGVERWVAATLRTLRYLSRRWNGAIGLYGTTLLVLVAVLGPVLLGGRALAQSNLALSGPSSAHWMGTDELGRDVLSRVVVGVRASLVTGVGSILLGGLLGVVAGVPAGYFGGWLEALVMRFVDALLAFPSVFLAIGTAAFLGPGPGNTLAAVAIVYFPVFARIARASTLGERRREYVDAARTIGLRSRKIMFGEITPNIASPLLVSLATSAPGAIMLVASLDFLGLGEQPPAPSLGQMVADSRQYISQDVWYALFPGLALVLVVLVLSMLGTTLPDALDPTRRSTSATSRRRQRRNPASPALPAGA